LDDRQQGTQMQGSYRAESVRSRRSRVRNFGDRLTGGGLRALFKRVRQTGDRLTGGGVRSLSKRIATKSLQAAMRQPLLKSLGCRVLQPFPILSAIVYRLATAPATMATTADTGQKGATRAKILAAFAGSNEALEKAAAPSSVNPTQIGDPSLLVNSLYKAAFGRLADPTGLADCIQKLQSGVSLEALAEQIVTSVEFLTRHGSNRRVDKKYLTALHCDGLGHQPNLENLAFWLAQGEAGLTRAKVLATVAGSDEALENLRVPAQDSDAVYHRWVAGNDTIGDVDRTMIRTHIAGLPFCPLISVIVHLDRITEVEFRESLNSVTTQLYPYWELCITIDEVMGPLLSRVLSDSEDPRIKVTELNGAEGATAATNAALSLATGEFVTVLRSGDILPEHALYEVAFELGRNERTDIVYTDNDQIGPDAKRSSPWFKPGWDPDLLLAQDYISHLAVYRRTLVEAVGLLRPDFEGAQFHDLALRATAATTPDRVRHIPAILYHRREEDKAIRSENALPGLRATTATHRAVRDHLDSRGDKEAFLKPAPIMPSAIRVIWPIPAPEPLVSVIIPTRDRADLLQQCVDGVLHRTEYSNLELLIVDNESAEIDTFTLLDRLTHSDSRVRILHHPGPFNYSALNNAAAREARGEVLLLLNNDVDVIESGWLRELVSHAIRPDIGIVGAKLLYANEKVQHGGILLGGISDAVVHAHRNASKNDPGYFGQLALARTLSAVTGACLAIRRAVFFEVGGFDEVNLVVAYNDVDLCLRVGDYGYRVVWTPFAELFHLESASRGQDDTPAKRELFKRELGHMRRTWGSHLEFTDPYHNPNLLFSWDLFECPSAPRQEKPWRRFAEQFLTWNAIFRSQAITRQ
jgi:O-antigen biosynthesis protein